MSDTPQTFIREPAPPLPPVTGPLTPAERIRLQQLRSQSRTFAEQTEFDGLVARDVPDAPQPFVQAGPQHDHTPDEKAPMTPEESARATELRAMPAPSNAEKTEMDALNLREADLAGHVVAEPAKAVSPELAAEVFVLERIAAGFEHMAAVLPSAAPLGRIAAELRGHAADLLTPPKPVDPKADKPAA